MLIDIIVGYFIPEFFGWVFLFFVIVIEVFLLKKLLSYQEIRFQRLLVLIVVANSLTTLLGFIFGELIHLDFKSHIGHIINLVPIDYYRGEYMFGRAVFIYMSSFVVTMIFETLIFYIGLKKYNLRFKEVIKISLNINLVSYLVGLLVICIYSMIFILN